jgi:hypothetical protein
VTHTHHKPRTAGAACAACQKRAAEGLKVPGKAGDLAPANARFAYVYAVASHDAGQLKDAMQVLATIDRG